MDRSERTAVDSLKRRLYAATRRPHDWPPPPSPPQPPHTGEEIYPPSPGVDVPGDGGLPGDSISNQPGTDTHDTGYNPLDKKKK